MTGDWPPPGQPATHGRAEVVVLVGLQGSGKSTFYRQRFAATHVLVSRDRFRNNPRPSRRQRELIRAALQGGRSVVVDNTNAAPADRAAIVEVGRALGARVVCFYFGRDIRKAIAQNARREGKERIPVVGILATAKRLVPPTLAEGFDEVNLVESTPDGRVIVRPFDASTTRDDEDPGAPRDPEAG